MRFNYDTTKDIVDDPLKVDRSLRESDFDELCRVVAAHFPLLPEPEKNISHHAICMYTMTDDEHFLIDFHPQFGKNVVVASPCSGHGYKVRPSVIFFTFLFYFLYVFSFALRLVR